MKDSERKVRELGLENQRLKKELEETRDKCEHLKRLLGVDYLTKALSRYAIGEILEEEVAYSRRTETPLSLIFLDIDDFKKVNDQLGHPAGDAVLIQLVERLQIALRRYDKVGRYGGEEFLVVLRGVPLDRANIVAERLRKKVADKPFDFEGKKIDVTISQGIAGLKCEHAQKAFGLIRDADEAMFEAKKGGKNCVVLNGTY